MRQADDAFQKLIHDIRFTVDFETLLNFIYVPLQSRVNYLLNTVNSIMVWKH